MDTDNSNSNSECTPPEIGEAAKITCLKILPTKSRARYERTYEEFINWRKGKDIKSSFSENVLLAYMDPNKYGQIHCGDYILCCLLLYI